MTNSEQTRKDSAIEMLADHAPDSAGKAYLLLQDAKIKGNNEFLHEIIAGYFQKLPQIEAERGSPIEQGLLLLIQTKPDDIREAQQILNNGGIKMSGSIYQKVIKEYFNYSEQRQELEAGLDNGRWPKPEPINSAEELFKLLNFVTTATKGLRGLQQNKVNPFAAQLGEPPKMTSNVIEAATMCADTKARTKPDCVKILKRSNIKLSGYEFGVLCEAFNYANCVKDLLQKNGRNMLDEGPKLNASVIGKRTEYLRPEKEVTNQGFQMGDD